MLSNIINCIYVDHDQSLWLGIDLGVSHFKGGIFETTILPNCDKTLISNNQLNIPLACYKKFKIEFAMVLVNDYDIMCYNTIIKRKL